MVKDKRYTVLKKLVEGGNIFSFTDMLDVVPISTIRNDLKTNYSSLKRKINQPELFVIKDLLKIAELIDCNPDLIIKLSTKDYLRRKKQKK